MNVIFFYGSMIAVIVFVNSMVFVLKKVKNNEDTSGGTVLMCISLMFIMYSIFLFCAR